MNEQELDIQEQVRQDEFYCWQQERQREENIEQLGVKLSAHESLLFPFACQGKTIRKVDLEQAVHGLHELVHAFLISDHRYGFFDAVELERLRKQRTVFDIALNRMPPRQRLTGADRDYFLRVIDIDDHLAWVLTKMRR